MQTSDDTQPRNPFKEQSPPAYTTLQTGQIVYPDTESDMGGPGCIMWGIVGMFSVLLAGALVIISAFVGWNSGITIARSNATATLAAEVQVQCEQMQTSIESRNTGLLQRRIEFLELQTPSPECLTIYIPTATALYIQSLPTETFTPTETPSPTITLSPEATQVVEFTPTDEAIPTDTNSLFDYDLDALLAEAESQLSQQQYQDAIDTLDAIIAIDENFQRTNVETLFFSAMTAEATRLFRTGKLAEGIVLTGRAEAYGDIQGLNYERFIAQLFLDAQRLKITNPAESVRLFNRIAYEQGLINYLNGQVITELQEALVNYGNSLSEQGNFCAARDQYTVALELQPIVSNISRGDVIGKRDSATQVCSTGATPVGGSTPIDGETSGDTNAVPTIQPSPTIAPVGQQG